ncbi:MAG: hypothetical protein E7346_05560 [Clostridiales bacterium]|nr:hypothetical protein [Clostridiales bacterium]
MKKALSKILALILATLLVFGCTACGNSSGLPKNYTKLPDYSGTTDELKWLACSGPMSGRFKIGGEWYDLGPDLRTKEGYTDYLDAGMNVVYLSGTAAECSPTFDESECKRAMVAAAEAGAEKILIADKRIWNLAEKNNLVGEGLTYPTYDDLKNKVKGYLSDYIEMDGFYGVSIYDEPVYEFTVSLRYIYNAVYDAWAELVEEKNITKAIKDYIYIYICLLPYSSTYSRYGAPGQFTDMGEAYKHYIESYLTPTLEGIVDENGEPIQFRTPDYMMVDVYAPRATGLSADYFVSVKTLKDACEKYGTKPSFAITSFEMYNGNSKVYRGAYKSEMMLEIYSLLGTGYNGTIAWYTYQPAETLSSFGSFNEQFNFVTRSGEKTNIYYYAQDMMAKAKETAKIVLNYKYQGGRFFFADMPNYDTGIYVMGNSGTIKYDDPDSGETVSKASALQIANDYQFALLKSATFDNDALYATELKDEKNNLYMYMLQNVCDPAHGNVTDTFGTVKATFDSSYTHVAEIKDGRLSYVALSDGVYEEGLSAGQAVYLVPLK